MSRIVVIGGHGKIARLLLPLLTGAGHQVTAIIRNPDHATEVAATAADPLVADVERLDVSALAGHFAGHDAIVWSAGAGGGDPARTYAVDRDAAIRSMKAAAAAGVSRYLMVSYFGAGPDHGVPEDDSFFPYADAKSAADRYLTGTDLNWTVLGPSRLTDAPATGRIETDEQGAVPGEVPRADVAAVLLAALDDPSTIGRTIRFNTGPTPIAVSLSTPRPGTP
ncbi:MAG TPA: SDR family oxidoreductase [Actinoplanes sp.]|nr:SDR family oxidoreductase [Actinoplanes sp.]